MPLNLLIGGAKNTDVNRMECMGPASDPSHMVSLVGYRVYPFDTFLRVEIRGYRRPRERWLASPHAHSSPWTSSGNHRPCSPWTAQLFDDSQDVQKVWKP